MNWVDCSNFQAVILILKIKKHFIQFLLITFDFLRFVHFLALCRTIYLLIIALRVTPDIGREPWHGSTHNTLNIWNSSPLENPSRWITILLLTFTRLNIIDVHKIIINFNSWTSLHRLTIVWPLRVYTTPKVVSPVFFKQLSLTLLFLELLLKILKFSNLSHKILSHSQRLDSKDL